MPYGDTILLSWGAKESTRAELETLFEITQLSRSLTPEPML